MPKIVLVIVSSHKRKNKIISITENKPKQEHLKQEFVRRSEFLLLLHLQNPTYSG